MTPTTFLKCFNKGERWKYAGKEVCLNRVWNSQPPGHEFDMVITEPSWWGNRVLEFNAVSLYGKKSLQDRPTSVLSVLWVFFFLWFRRVRINCSLIALNPIPSNKFQTPPKLKQLADENFNFEGNDRNFSKRVENTVGKGEIALYEQFFLFPLSFQKIVLQTRKNRRLFGKALISRWYICANCK